MRVRAFGARGADPLERARLQETQQLGLQADVHLPDFIEEQSAFRSQMRGPVPVTGGAGKGTFNVAEKFGLNQVFGDGSAVENHQLPPYEKANWRSDEFTMDERWAMYNDQSRDAELIAEVNQKLQDLEPLIHCPDCATEGGVSLDDIDLWSRLRSLTIVKGLVFPPKVRAYLDTFADRGDLPLYDAIAL